MEEDNRRFLFDNLEELYKVLKRSKNAILDNTQERMGWEPFRWVDGLIRVVRKIKASEPNCVNG